MNVGSAHCIPAEANSSRFESLASTGYTLDLITFRGKHPATKDSVVGPSLPLLLTVKIIAISLHPCWQLLAEGKHADLKNLASTVWSTPAFEEVE